MNVGDTRYLEHDGRWLPVEILHIDSAPWSDIVIVRWPDGQKTKADANFLEGEPPDDAGAPSDA